MKSSFRLIADAAIVSHCAVMFVIASGDFSVYYRPSSCHRLGVDKSSNEDMIAIIDCFMSEGFVSEAQLRSGDCTFWFTYGDDIYLRIRLIGLGHERYSLIAKVFRPDMCNLDHMILSNEYTGIGGRSFGGVLPIIGPGMSGRSSLLLALARDWAKFSRERSRIFIFDDHVGESHLLNFQSECLDVYDTDFSRTCFVEDTSPNFVLCNFPVDKESMNWIIKLAAKGSFIAFIVEACSIELAINMIIEMLDFDKECAGRVLCEVLYGVFFTMIVEKAGGHGDSVLAYFAHSSAYGVSGVDKSIHKMNFSRGLSGFVRNLIDAGTISPVSLSGIMDSALLRGTSGGLSGDF